MTNIIISKHILLAITMLSACLMVKGQNILRLSHRYVADSLEVSFTNTSQADTAYLFSSYFKDVAYHSRYIHRYNRKEGTHKVSFIPFSSLLSSNGVLSCRVFFGDRKLIEHGGMRWEFIPVLPMQSATVNIPISALTYDSYTVDFNMKKYKIWSPDIEFKPITTPVKKLHVEFAYFTDVSWLKKKAWVGYELATWGDHYIKVSIPIAMLAQ